MRLEGKVAIVTGGGLGIGKAYCLGLAAEGAKVAVVDIDGERAESTAREIGEKGGEALAIHTDVSNEKGTSEMVQRTVDRFGTVDILVNNAALFAALGPAKPWHELDVDEWDRVMAVNLKGAFLCAKAVFPYMKAKGRGKIINIGSGSAYRGSVGRLHYLTSKAGIFGLTRGLARELGPDNINVNTLAPGATVSEGIMFRRKDTGDKDRSVAPRCIKRLLYPEDLVGALIFLASDESDMMSGQTVVVDGGAGFV